MFSYFLFNFLLNFAVAQTFLPATPATMELVQFQARQKAYLAQNPLYNMRIRKRQETVFATLSLKIYQEAEANEELGVYFDGETPPLAIGRIKFMSLGELLSYFPEEALDLIFKPTRRLNVRTNDGERKNLDAIFTSLSRQLSADTDFAFSLGFFMARQLQAYESLKNFKNLEEVLRIYRPTQTKRVLEQIYKGYQKALLRSKKVDREPLIEAKICKLLLKR